MTKIYDDERELDVGAVRAKLTDQDMSAFAALCLHLPEQFAGWSTEYVLAQATGDITLMEYYAREASKYTDAEKICNTLVRRLEGPGRMPGTITVRSAGKTFTRTVNSERGEPFSSEQLARLCATGIVHHPEFHYADLTGGEQLDIDVYFLTHDGIEFALEMFPERLPRMKPKRPKLTDDDRARMVALRNAPKGDATPEDHAFFQKVLTDFVSNRQLMAFEALCFLRESEVETPYTMLSEAPRMYEDGYVEPIVQSAYKEYQDLRERMKESEIEQVSQFMAEKVGWAITRPGCVGTLIETDSEDGGASINIQEQIGGWANGSFGGFVYLDMVFDPYSHFEDAFGPGTGVTVSREHLTSRGVAFALWLFPERIAAMKQREGALPRD